MKILFLILTYIIGSISFAYIVAKVFKGIDIRKVGSGNPGATNVYRVSKPLGLLAFLCDTLKGFVPVFIAAKMSPSSDLFVIAVIFAVILGHMFTIFLNFKGGKGVATGCGAFLAINPLATLICLLVFAVVLSISKYVSLSSICAAIMLPISLSFFGCSNEILVFSIIVAAIVVIKHSANIKRLFAGTENKI
ncbi:MAG: glycerol-3-phosphate 1-O-acyltransferase PlsY [Elusimicrobia bacterium]|nr:glycerol-3-phosphate 1-O-acyltransferase PlsY [Elusimicrobiota bacterium]